MTHHTGVTGVTLGVTSIPSRVSCVFMTPMTPKYIFFNKYVVIHTVQSSETA